MEFSSDDAKMWHEPDSKTVFFEGTFRLNAEQYDEMSKMLNGLLAENPDYIKLDLTGLEFLNSSGINVIARFVIAVRNGKTTKLSIVGSKNIPWQGKSLPNLKKLYPAVELVID